MPINGINTPWDMFLEKLKWSNRKKATKCPSVITGALEISKRREGIFIGGDPRGLRSLAKLLLWLANLDQEKHSSMPDGEREHVPLYAVDPTLPYNSLTPFR